VRSVAAIVLLLWAVCYGRCLAEQYGVVKEQAVAQCSVKDTKDSPDQCPSSTDEVCEFIQAGSVLLTQPVVLDAPFLFQLVVEDFHFLTLQAILAEAEAEQAVVLNTDSPRPVRLWEWMASTAQPVRGPSLGLS